MEGEGVKNKKWHDWQQQMLADYYFDLEISHIICT
jgi:hypothetical protein